MNYINKDILNYLDSRFFNSTLQYHLKILDSLDNITRAHSENVAYFSYRLCINLKMPNNFITHCTICAYIHDIGKIFIPTNILQKEGPLTSEEYDKIKEHTILGCKICDENAELAAFIAGPKYHHEYLDGSRISKWIITEILFLWKVKLLK